MKRQTIGVFNGIVAAASYGTNPLFALPLYARGIGVNSVLFYRYAIAVLIYGLWIKFYKKISLNLSIEEFFPIFFLGIFFSLSSLTLFDAFQYIEAGVACTILFIYPVIVALIMAVFFKEKITKTVIFSILLTFTGICLLYGGKPGTTLNLHGVLLVLASALLYALYIAYSARKIEFLCNAFRASGLYLQLKILYTAADTKYSFYVVMYNSTCSFSYNNIA